VARIRGQGALGLELAIGLDALADESEQLRVGRRVVEPDRVGIVGGIGRDALSDDDDTDGITWATPARLLMLVSAGTRLTWVSSFAFVPVVDVPVEAGVVAVEEAGVVAVPVDWAGVVAVAPAVFGFGLLPPLVATTITTSATTTSATTPSRIAPPRLEVTGAGAPGSSRPKSAGIRAVAGCGSSSYCWYSAACAGSAAAVAIGGGRRVEPTGISGNGLTARAPISEAIIRAQARSGGEAPRRSCTWSATRGGSWPSR
jgi:hypothetical protein